MSGQDGLLRRVAARCPDFPEATLRQALHSALLHLRRRLPLDVERHLLEALPEARALSATPKLEATFETGQRPVEHVDRVQFLHEVREEGGLRDLQEATRVVRAMLASVAELLPSPEALHVRTELPRGLQELWVEALEQPDVLSVDMERFRQEVMRQFQATSDEQFERVVRSVVSHLLHRVGDGEEGRILRYLPEEVRLRISHLQPPPGGGETPAEHLTAGELVKSVQEEAGLPDEATARQAVLGVLRAVSVAARRRIPSLLQQLPEDWQNLVIDS